MVQLLLLLLLLSPRVLAAVKEQSESAEVDTRD
jgi:hypothetical protein